LIDRLADPKQTLNIVLPDYRDPEFPVLGRIPRYDDVTLPSEEMTEFLAELDLVRHKAQTAADQAYLQRLVDLVARCKDTSGTSLQFLGD
jgi:hypothetical protein